MKTSKERNNSLSIFGMLTIIFLCLTAFSIDGFANPIAIKHVTNSSNIQGHITTIDNPFTNGKPNLLLIATHNYVNGPYQKPAFGVWYSAGKWKIYNENRTAMSQGVTFNVLVTKPSANSFSHKATKTTITNNYTIIDNPALNNNPNVEVLVTQNWKSTYNTNSIGVWYTGSKWSVYNQNKKAMPVGTNFNIFITSKSSTGKHFLHNAGGSASSSHISYLNNAATNNKPGAAVFQTQNWKNSGPYNDHEVGVWYSSGKWTVYNEDRVKLPNNAKFNIFALDFSATGLDVKWVQFGQNGRELGVYKQVGNTKNWKEVGSKSGATFNFVERNRDDWSVYLYDKSRDVHIQLDLHTKKVMYSEGSGAKSPIYTIMDSK